MSPPPADNFAARIFVGPALRAQPDRRLVDLVRKGYDAAFEEIVRRYRRPLDRFAAAIVGGRSEDVTQDAFSKALLALRGTDQESSGSGDGSSSASKSGSSGSGGDACSSGRGSGDPEPEASLPRSSKRNLTTTARDPAARATAAASAAGLG
jgi:hypothetical protein